MNYNFCSQKMLKELNGYWGGGYDAMMTVMLVLLQNSCWLLFVQ
jgi:hypothetical protein